MYQHLFSVDIDQRLRSNVNRYYGQGRERETQKIHIILKPINTTKSSRQYKRFLHV